MIILTLCFIFSKYNLPNQRNQLVWQPLKAYIFLDIFWKRRKSKEFCFVLLSELSGGIYNNYVSWFLIHFLSFSTNGKYKIPMKQSYISYIFNLVCQWTLFHSKNKKKVFCKKK